MAGVVQGAIGGVSTEIELKAKYEYDLQQKRITWFALLIKEKRAVGHVSPGTLSTARNSRGKRSISLCMSCAPRSTIRSNVS